jgi:hypothetical protein
MRFLTLYKTPETGVPPTPEKIAAMGRLIDDWTRAGVLVTTAGCLPSALGARVRQANGRVTTTDGPFTESKEVVGGFAVIEAPSKGEAIRLVEEFLRVAGDGETELRQMYEDPEPRK